MSISVGSLLGSYRILATLGQGGMGTVYLGEHVEIQRRAAVKVLRADLCESPHALARFKAEAQAVNRIRHEHIVEVTDFGLAPGGEAYYVMEQLEGDSLAGALKSQGAMSLERVLHIGIQVADALAASHGVGIVHRDLKPGNVFLVSRGGDPDYVKLLDFGIAKLVGEDKPADMHTRTGVPLGTPHYMSPEQCRGQGVDARSDIYALGVMLFEMLAGRLPFLAENWMGILMAHVSTPFPSVRALRPEVPAEVDALLARCAAKQAADRFADMASTRAELMRLLREAVAARGPGEGPPDPSAAAWGRALAHPTTAPTRGPSPAPHAQEAHHPPGRLTMAVGPQGQLSTVPSEELMLEVALEKEDVHRIVELSGACSSVPLLVRSARYLRNLLAFAELVTVCHRILALEPGHVGALELCALALMKQNPKDLEEPTRLLLEASRLAEEQGVEDLSQVTLPPGATGVPPTPWPSSGGLTGSGGRAMHEGEALLGRLYKQVWRQAWDQGPDDVAGNRRRAAEAKASLLKAVSNYERAHQRMDESYPGVNVATLYALMGQLTPPPLPESQRARRVERILPAVRERLARQVERARLEKDRDQRDEALYWAHVSRAELLLATQAPAAEVMMELDEATTCAGSRKFLLQSTLDQLVMLRSLGFRDEVVAEAAESLQAWL